MDTDGVAIDMFPHDLIEAVNVAGACIHIPEEDREALRAFDYIHDLVISGPCATSPIEENEALSKVEVCYDGSTNLIVSSGIEKSVDEVRQLSDEETRLLRLRRLRRLRGLY